MASCAADADGAADTQVPIVKVVELTPLAAAPNASGHKKIANPKKTPNSPRASSDPGVKYPDIRTQVAIQPSEGAEAFTAQLSGARTHGPVALASNADVTGHDDTRAPAPASANKRTAEQAGSRAEDELSAHGSTSDADVERLVARQKLARAKKQVAQAELEEAQVEVDLSEAKANSSGGSHRSRSDHGTPVHHSHQSTPVRAGSTRQQFQDKMAQRKKLIDGAPSSPAASSNLDIIAEGTVAPVPVLPPALAFPGRAPSPRDSAPIGDAYDMVQPSPPGSVGQVRTRAPASSSDKSVDIDDYARASAVQQKVMLKHKQQRPPTPPGAHTPRSVVSVASTRTRAELAATKLRLEQAEQRLAAEADARQRAEAQAMEERD